MKYGFVMPYGDARLAADLAAAAEDGGWDGFFVWEAIWGVDAWVALTAAAMSTRRVRLGTMLTPLPRRRPWDVASQSATLDNLSGGRVNLAVGLGATDNRWWLFEDDPGRRTRAERLDEGLAVLTGLWSGQPFAFAGKHYTARPTTSMVPAPPVQVPRIPIWVVGGWPAARSMRRAARWDGWLPNVLPRGDGPADLTPDTVRTGAEWIRERRAAEGLPTAGYDIVVEGTTPADDPAAARARVAPWADAGATWWIEADWSVEQAQVRPYALRRLAAGPPR
ncbi:MAG TPA: LLM class flavin-dependent oxidoreductase [Micromonosporaceae bacterium]|jgi:alkanesulfonate monooxygenase SsuD/methylene tetrahydromethanopterin reductase-like flavin-dependent oxidoreductase (luciferase family)